MLYSYLDAYKAQNITHWGITIQNEPMYSLPFNSMRMTAPQMRDFLAGTLGPELARSGWGTDKLKVMIYDCNFPDLEEFVRVIFANATARNYAAGTAIHWYTHSPHTMLDVPHNLYPNKFILATEACVQFAVKIGDWHSAELYAQDILNVKEDYHLVEIHQKFIFN